MARLRSSPSAKMAVSRESEVGTNAAAPTPCKIRAEIKTHGEGARPPTSEETPSSAIVTMVSSTTAINEARQSKGSARYLREADIAGLQTGPRECACHRLRERRGELSIFVGVVGVELGDHEPSEPGTRSECREARYGLFERKACVVLGHVRYGGVHEVYDVHVEVDHEPLRGVLEKGEGFRSGLLRPAPHACGRVAGHRALLKYLDLRRVRLVAE